jgi:ABC-type nitrate/sulfonate/bicarbonate transport system ATPase subunit
MRWPRLLPWNSVLANVEVGVGTADGRTRALAILREVGLEDRRNDWPSALSGGQKQRSPSPARWSAGRACWPSTSRSAPWTP